MRTDLCVVQRLYAHRIAGNKQSTRARVPNGKCKDSPEFSDGAFAPTGIRLQQYLSIRMAPERLAQSFDFSTNLPEVVDFAVVDDPISSIGIVHRLMPQGGQVENCETTVAQPDLGLPVAEQNGSLIVRAAMRERARSALQEPVGDPSVMGNNTEDSTHLVLPGHAVFPYYRVRRMLRWRRQSS